MFSKKLTYLMLALPIIAHARFETQGNQGRVSASEKIALQSIVPESLKGANTKISNGCIDLLSDPVVKIRSEVKVLKNGSTESAEINEYMSERVGKIIGCAAAIGAGSAEISNQLQSKRPTRADAIKIASAVFKKRFDEDYKKFQGANQQAYSQPVLIAKDNGGYTKEYQVFNDPVVQMARPNMDGKSAHDQELKILVDGGENNVVSKGGYIREIIFDGIYAFYINPFTLVSECEKGSCKDAYSLKYDTKNIEIFKNGQQWYSADRIAGISYSIDVSSERSSSTTKKVLR